MTERMLLYIILAIVSTLSLAIITSSVANFFAVRALVRMQSSHKDLMHRLCKESMDRVLAATDLAAFYKVRDAESPPLPKPPKPILWKEI